jgi:hypothetical protein
VDKRCYKKHNRREDIGNSKTNNDPLDRTVLNYHPLTKKRMFQGIVADLNHSAGPINTTMISINKAFSELIKCFEKYACATFSRNFMELCEP